MLIAANSDMMSFSTAVSQERREYRTGNAYSWNLDII